VSEWLSKSEVNELYYSTVAGDIAFETEAALGYHPGTVARLILGQAASLGKESARILEIGAGNCAFARALLGDLRMLGATDWLELRRIDYLAVDLSRSALEAAVLWEEAQGTHRRVRWPGGVRAPGRSGRPERPDLVALVTLEGEEVNLGYVHADANQFIRANTQAFDFVILNELLDDVACRAYYADGEGRPFEIVPLARDDGRCWTVRIDAAATGDLELPPASVTATSSECVELVTGAAGALGAGGVLLVHDYGFADPVTTIADYEQGPPSQPAFVDMEYPPGSEEGFPRGFFRVFGNDAKRVIQVTNDVNFAELAGALESTGTVLTVPHGNQIVTGGVRIERGQGVFLAEIGLLEPDDDVPALLTRLRDDQAEARHRYSREHTAGHRSLFLDLVYLKS
jgi:hypothetical protein